jgi:hypothetical protein
MNDDFSTMCLYESIMINCMKKINYSPHYNQSLNNLLLSIYWFILPPKLCTLVQFTPQHNLSFLFLHAQVDFLSLDFASL